MWEFILAGFGNQVPFGWLDTVHAYNLSGNEVKDLANFMSEEAIKLGWKGLQTPFFFLWANRTSVNLSIPSHRNKQVVDAVHL